MLSSFSLSLSFFLSYITKKTIVIFLFSHIFFNQKECLLLFLLLQFLWSSNNTIQYTTTTKTNGELYIYIFIIYYMKYLEIITWFLFSFCDCDSFSFGLVVYLLLFLRPFLWCYDDNFSFILCFNSNSVL